MAASRKRPGSVPHKTFESSSLISSFGKPDRGVIFPGPSRNCPHFGLHAGVLGLQLDKQLSKGGLGNNSQFRHWVPRLGRIGTELHFFKDRHIDWHLGLDGRLLRRQLERLGDLGRGVPLALFLLLSLSHRGELVHDAFQRGLLVILLFLRWHLHGAKIDECENQ